MIKGHELNLLLSSLAAMMIIRDVNAKSEPSPIFIYIHGSCMSLPGCMVRNSLAIKF